MLGVDLDGGWEMPLRGDSCAADMDLHLSVCPVQLDMLLRCAMHHSALCYAPFCAAGFIAWQLL